MPRDTDDNAMGKAMEPVLEALDRLLEVQEKHDEILTHLEQRDVPDMQGLARRLEDVADAVERLKGVQGTRPSKLPMLGVVLLALICGWLVCWMTVRWLPNTMLPPGFSRTPPVQPKGRF